MRTSMVSGARLHHGRVLEEADKNPPKVPAIRQNKLELKSEEICEAVLGFPQMVRLIALQCKQ